MKSESERKRGRGREMNRKRERKRAHVEAHSALDQSHDLLWFCRSRQKTSRLQPPDQYSITYYYSNSITGACSFPRMTGVIRSGARPRGTRLRLAQRGPCAGHTEDESTPAKLGKQDISSRGGGKNRCAKYRQWRD